MLKVWTAKFLKDPVGLIVRGFRKTLIDPFRYKSGAGYAADRYWRDRFSKYGTNLQGAGDESMSREENEKMYARAGARFREIAGDQGLDFSALRVLEIGVGAAFYTGVLRDMGVRDYTGFDITDVMFPQHRQAFPGCTFIKGDITSDSPRGTFDLVVMIDVCQHIVEKEKFSRALETIRGALAGGGTFIIGPLAAKDARHHYYVHVWSPAFVGSLFPGFEVREYEGFRGGTVVVLKKRN